MSATGSDPHFYEHGQHLTPQYLERLGVYFARGVILTLVLAVLLVVVSFTSMSALDSFSMPMMPLVLAPLLAPTLLYLSWHIIHQVKMLSARRHQLQTHTAAILQDTLHRVAPELSVGECEQLTEGLMRLQPDGGLPVTQYASGSEFFAPIIYCVQRAEGRYQLVRQTPLSPAQGRLVEERWPLVF